MASGNIRNIGRLGVIIVVSILSIASWFLVNSPPKFLQESGSFAPLEIWTTKQLSMPIIPVAIRTTNQQLEPVIPHDISATSEPVTPHEISTADQQSVPVTPVEISTTNQQAVPVTPVEISTTNEQAVPVTPVEIRTTEEQSEAAIARKASSKKASVITGIPFRRNELFRRYCPETGPDSAAPSNDVDVSAAIVKAVQHIRSRNSNAIIVCTTVNQEAAIQNLPSFLLSLAEIKPPLSLDTIVFCLDEVSISQCSKLHADPTLCLSMDMGVSGADLIPHLLVKGTNNLVQASDFRTRSYWRLTYGRVFATLAIHNEGISVLPVDADAVFLTNPFVDSEEISRHPDSVAGVVDSRYFNLNTTDEGLLINGGFLYFPSTTAKSALISNKVLQNIWKQNCIAKNEQLVTSSVIKDLYKSLPPGDHYAPQLLSGEKYLNFCHFKCGTGDEFSHIKSLDDLHKLEEKFQNNPDFKYCTKPYRKQWVYFHAACTAWPNLKGLGMAKAKGDVQKAIMEWVKESRAV